MPSGVFRWEQFSRESSHVTRIIILVDVLCILLVDVLLSMHLNHYLVEKWQRHHEGSVEWHNGNMHYKFLSNIFWISTKSIFSEIPSPQSRVTSSEPLGHLISNFLTEEHPPNIRLALKYCSSHINVRNNPRLQWARAP
jgi:hypothetical protein